MNTATAKHIQTIRMSATDISQTSFDQILKSSENNLIVYSDYIHEIQNAYDDMIKELFSNLLYSDSDYSYVNTLGLDTETPLTFEIFHDAGGIDQYDASVYSFGKMYLRFKLHDCDHAAETFLCVIYPYSYVCEQDEILSIIKTKDYWDDFIFAKSEMFQDISKHLQIEIKDFESFKKFMPLVLKDHFEKLVDLAKAMHDHVYIDLKNEEAIDSSWIIESNEDLRVPKNKLQTFINLGIKDCDYLFRKANKLISLTRENADLTDLLINTLEKFDDSFKNMLEFERPFITAAVSFDVYDIKNKLDKQD